MINHNIVKHLLTKSYRKRHIAILIAVGVTILSACFLFGCSSSENNATGSGPNNEPVGKLYVLNQGEKSLFVYNSQTMARIDSIDTRVSQPHYIDFSPDGQNYYIVTLEQLGGHIAKFNASNDQFVDSVAVPVSVIPSAITITADNVYGYVGNFTANYDRTKIHKFNLNSMQHVDSIPAGAMTHDLKITSDGSTIVACNMNTDDITIVNTATDTVIVVPMDTNNIAPVPHVYGPYGVIIDHKDSLAYIACNKNNQVRVLDIAKGKIVDSILIPVHVSAPLAGPTLMVISPNDDVVFVTTQVGNSVVAFRTSDGSILADIPLFTPKPFGISMSDDGTRVYVACIGETNTHGSVYVIDGNNYSIVDVVDVGNLSYGLVWHSGTP